jgi:molecular chaperone DnaJ
MSSDRDASGNLYDTLGLGADATDAEITRAYRRLAREHHPDSNPDSTAGAFSELADAYDVLRDPARRRAYDNARRGRARASTQAAAGIRIPVHHATAPGTPRTPPPAGRDAATPTPDDVEVNVTFDQAALGTTAVLTIDTEHPCRACNGTGVAPTHDATCGNCGGSGSTTRRSGGINIRTQCPTCRGTGRTRPDPCTACDGARTQRKTSDVTVRVPAGVDTGVKLPIPLPDGSQILGVVRASPHPYFQRNGIDLNVRVPVTIAEAALGGVITVPTLDSAIAIQLPPGTPHRRTLRVKGRGVHQADRRGDLLVTIDIVIPPELNDAQRTALEAFAAATQSPRQHLEAAGDAEPAAETVPRVDPTQLHPGREEPHGRSR